MLKKLITTVVAIAALLSLCILGFVFLSDPNQYKADIENAIAKSGLNVRLNGDVSWSFFPLALSIDDISILTQEDAVFTRFNSLSADVEIESYLPFEIRMRELAVSGLNLELVRDEQGNKNWQDLLRAQPDTSSEQASSGSGLAIAIDRLVVSDSKVSYLDLANAQAIHVDGIQLEATELRFDQPVALKLEAKASSEQFPSFSLSSSAFASLRSDLSVFEVKAESGAAQLGRLPLDMAFEVSIFTERSTAHLKTLQLTTPGSSLELKGFGSFAEASQGTMTFTFESESLLALLSDLDENFTLTDQSPVLKVQSSTTLKLVDEGYRLKPFVLSVNDDKWWGSALYSPDAERFSASVNGGALNLDRLTALIASVQTHNPDTSTSPQDVKTSTPWLDKTYDIALKHSSVKYKEWEAYDAKLSFSSDTEQATWDASIGIFMGGNLSAKGRIKPEGDQLSWTAQGSAFNLNAIESLGTKDFLGWELSGQGLLNAELYLESIGQNKEQVIDSLSGLLSYTVESGSLLGVNFQQLGCEAVSKINRSAIKRTDWRDQTDIEILAGEFEINGLTLTAQNTELVSDGFSVNATGDIDLVAQSLAMDMDVRPDSDMGDEGCRIRYDLSTVPLPIQCTGSYAGEDSPTCQINTPTFESILTAFDETVEQKIEDGVEQLMETVDEQYSFDEETRQTVRDMLKSIIR